MVHEARKLLRLLYQARGVIQQPGKSASVALYHPDTDYLRSIFPKIADEFLEFIGDTVLVIHNASFDVGFLNAELGFIKRPPILYERIIDTLALAKKRHPMGPNSLDALCKRYGIDTAKRTKHGALLDSELLASVYLELIGGRQITLTLPKTDNVRHLQTGSAPLLAKRSQPLPERLTSEELARHQALVKSLGASALWKAT